MDDDEPRFDLVMPFIVCRSQGGPYDDDSFSAGFMAGNLFAELESDREVDDGWRPIRTDLVPQIDLIAMHCGYRLDFDETEDEWTPVRIVRMPGR